MTNYFEELNKIDCKDKIEKKNGLSYLSWAFAWGELKKKHPTASYTIYENQQGWNYHTDGRTAWVKTGVSIDGLEHIEYLPVMDYRNKSIPLDSITSFDVNKTIQRSLTKAVARHGLGLYIYAGEDLPEDDSAADAFKKDVSNEKRKETIANKKAAEAYKSTPEGLKERHATCIAYLAKLSEIANKEAKSYQMANALASDLFAAGMEKEAGEIASLLDKKLARINDELPDFSGNLNIVGRIKKKGNKMKKYDVVAVVGEYTDKERKIKSVFRNVGELHTREDGTEFLMMNKDFNPMAVRQKDPSSDKVFLSLFKPTQKDAGQDRQPAQTQQAEPPKDDQRFNDEVPF